MSQSLYHPFQNREAQRLNGLYQRPKIKRGS
jgi:hypothetical protein